MIEANYRKIAQTKVDKFKYISF